MPLISMVVPVDDQDDVELLKNLVEPCLPDDVILLSSYYDLINYNFQSLKAVQEVHFYSKLFRFEIGKDSKLSTINMSVYEMTKKEK